MDDSHPPEEYNDTLVAMLELIWGEGFLSPGGPEAARAIVAGLDLEGRTVLDIGAGLGGIDMLLARAFGARVIGFEVEAPLVARGRERVAAAGLEKCVDLRLVEPGPLPLADASIDVVFGKDSWIHIADKRAFLCECFRVLKPGGALAAGDWLKGPRPYSKDMDYFFEMEGLTYHMETLEAYGAILRDCGFTKVQLTDIADQYRAQAHAELARMRGPLFDLMGERLGDKARAHFIENWRAMTVVLDKGELRPGRLRARKPD